MTIQKVQSSFISGIGYESSTKIMVVQFATGSSETHTGITPNQHKALMSAGSIGSHYNSHFKSKGNSTKGVAPVYKNFKMKK